MTLRKRRRPSPEFGIPPPFNAITGTHATLRAEGIFPYCALFQVAAADTYEDYVICRGFDTRIRKFIDYAAGDPDKPGISVAKPYGNRTIGAYTVAQVYPAFLPTQGFVGEGKAENYVPPSPTTVDWRIGQNAGTAPAAGTGGHPTALVDTITELIDHNGKYVQWMLVDRGEGESQKVLWGKATANWTDNAPDCDYITVNPCDDCEGTNPTAEVVTVLLPKASGQDPNVVIGDVIAYASTTDATNVCVSDYLDEKIGTVKMWALASGDVQTGWAIMNGTNNAAPYGSGIDLTDKFVRGAASSGGTGGKATHEHIWSLTIDPHAEDEISIALDHKHDVTIGPHTVEDLLHNHDVSDTPGEYVSQQASDLQLPTFVTCTGQPWAPHDFGVGEVIEYDSCDYTHDWGPLYHTGETEYAYGGGVIQGNKLYHNFEFTLKEAEHLPEYVEMIFIERIDNSAP